MTVNDLGLALVGMSAGADSRRTVELLEAEDEPDDEATEGGPREVVGDPGEEAADSARGEAESGGADDGWAIERSSREGKGRRGRGAIRVSAVVEDCGRGMSSFARVTKWPNARGKPPARERTTTSRKSIRGRCAVG